MTEEHQPQQEAAKEGAGLEQAATPASDQAGAIGAALSPESASQADESTSAAQATSEQTESESAKSAESTKAEAAKAESEPAASATAADKTETDKADDKKAADKKDAGEKAADKTDKVDGAESAAKGAEAKVAKSASEKADGADDEDDDESGKKKGNVGLLVAGLAGVVVIVLAVVAAFVWPGFLAGPGKPDNEASTVVKALSTKNAGEIDKVTCHGHDGKSVTHIPPQALQMISSVKPAGPTELSLDTEARAPMNLTLSQQGKTQDVQVDAVLGVTNGNWCLKGLSQREQQQ